MMLHHVERCKSGFITSHTMLSLYRNPILTLPNELNYIVCSDLNETGSLEAAYMFNLYHLVEIHFNLEFQTSQ